MPKKIDPEVRERVIRMIGKQRSDYPNAIALAKVIATRERIGVETVRRWIELGLAVAVGARPNTNSYVDGLC